MKKDEKVKIIYEQSSTLHRYFLNWRYGLIAGYIIIISALGYFILTWAQKPEHYSKFNYLLTCSCGIILSLLFAFMNHRITRLIWACQNRAYLCEKDLGFVLQGRFRYTTLGLYGGILDKKVRNDLDIGLEKPKTRICGIFNPLNHSGIINWFLLIVTSGFILLMLQTRS